MSTSLPPPAGNGEALDALADVYAYFLRRRTEKAQRQNETPVATTLGRGAATGAEKDDRDKRPARE